MHDSLLTTDPRPVQRSVPEGQYTSTIYELVADGKHTEVVQILSHELQNFPRSRAALSLLGYCYYQLQDFLNSASMYSPPALCCGDSGSGGCRYEKLVQYYPDVEDHKVSHAQALYKSGQYDEAMKACLKVEDPAYALRVMTPLSSCSPHLRGVLQMQALQAAIKYDQDDLAGAKVMLTNCPPEDVSTVVNWGCVLFKVCSLLTLEHWSC